MTDTPMELDAAVLAAMHAARDLNNAISVINSGNAREAPGLPWASLKLDGPCTTVALNIDLKVLISR